MLRNAFECFRVIAPKIMKSEDAPYMVRIWIALEHSHVSHDHKEQKTFAGVLHEIDVLRDEFRNEIEEVMPGGKRLRELRQNDE